MSGLAGLPADDAPIAGDTPIYRLVPTEQCFVDGGEWQFQSAAFDNTTVAGYEEMLEMSVVIGDTLEALDRDPRDLPRVAYPYEAERWGVAVLRASCIREVNEQTIRRSPTAAERAHGDVIGKKNSSRRKRLAACAEWLVPPLRPAV